MLTATQARTIRMPDFDVEEVVEKIKSRRSGYIEAYKDGREVLILFLLMNSTNWYYVVAADSYDRIHLPKDHFLKDVDEAN